MHHHVYSDAFQPLERDSHADNPAVTSTQYEAHEAETRSITSSSPVLLPTFSELQSPSARRDPQSQPATPSHKPYTRADLSRIRQRIQQVCRACVCVCTSVCSSFNRLCIRTLVLLCCGLTCPRCSFFFSFLFLLFLRRFLDNPVVHHLRARTLLCSRCLFFLATIFFFF